MYGPSGLASGLGGIGSLRFKFGGVVVTPNNVDETGGGIIWPAKGDASP